VDHRRPVPEDTLAKVQGAKGRGAGFVLPEGRVMTCAHVIDMAFGGSGKPDSLNLNPPSGYLEVEFPVVSPNRLIPMKVVAWGPAIDTTLDIAVLEAIPGATAPDGIAPVVGSPDSPADHQFRAYGVPQGAEVRGTYAVGKFLGPVGGGLIEVMSDVGNRDEFVRKGFSGSAAWDLDRQAVVGMVKAINANRALVIPYEYLLKVWPDIPLANSFREHAAKRAARHVVEQRLFRYIDRDQAENLGKACRESGLQPLLFIVHGGHDEDHELFIERLKEDDKCGIVERCGGIVDIDWPEYVPANQLEEEFFKLKRQLSNHFIFDGDEMHEDSSHFGQSRAFVDAVQRRLNHGFEETAFVVHIFSEYFDRHQERLLELWFRFWQEVATPWPQRQLVLFFMAHYSPGQPPSASGLRRSWLADVLRRGSKGDSGLRSLVERDRLRRMAHQLKYVKLEQLRSINRSHVRNWLKWLEPHEIARDLSYAYPTIGFNVEGLFSIKPFLPMAELKGHIPKILNVE
jgi:hypothetical protein